MPEWLKGTGCKPVGYAYVGSNPTPSTTQPFGEDGCGCSSMVEQQPSKLETRHYGHALLNPPALGFGPRRFGRGSRPHEGGEAVKERRGAERAPDRLGGP